MGHMHRQRTGVQSTRVTRSHNNKQTQHNDNEDYSPPHDNKAETTIFCNTIFADSRPGMVYSGQTGRFPVMSYRGHQYIFVMYVYDANAILLRPLKSREGAALLEACTSCYDYLQNRKSTPKMHVLDNECSKQLKQFIHKHGDTTIQLTETDNHSVNVSERAI